VVSDRVVTQHLRLPGGPAAVLVRRGEPGLRLLPLLALERIGMRERTTSVLRHAGAGAVTSLVVVPVVGRGGQPDLAVLAAVVAGVSLRGRDGP